MRVQGVLRNRDLLYFYMSISKVFLNYTDWHDVDEEMRTICICGGRWGYENYAGNTAGLTHRNMDTPSTEIWNSVASSNMKNSQIIRMVLMSTKTWCLLASAMGNGTMETRQVSHFEIYMIPLPLQEIMLLRSTSEIDHLLYGYSRCRRR